MMSSEESTDNDEKECLKVKALPWWGDIVNRMFADLNMPTKRSRFADTPIARNT